MAGGGTRVEAGSPCEVGAVGMAGVTTGMGGMRSPSTCSGTPVAIMAWSTTPSAGAATSNTSQRHAIISFDGKRARYLLFCCLLVTTRG